MKFREYIIEANKANTKQERLDARDKNPFMITKTMQNELKNKVQFTVVVNGNEIQFEQAGNRSWRGKSKSKYRMLDYSDRIPRTANEQLQFLADEGHILGTDKLTKIENTDFKY